MRKRIYILLAIAFLTAIGMTIALTTRPAEPSYDGRTLTEWLNSSVDQPQRSNAIYQIGARAVPTLLRMLQARDSAVKSNLINLVYPFVGKRYVTAEGYHFMAFTGFTYLRADAKDAVPDLIRILQQPPNGESQSIAAMSLGFIGPPATNAVLTLLHTATSSPPNVRSTSIWALSEIQDRPDLVVPMLIDRLQHDGNAMVRNNAALALGDFGTNAAAALPALIQVFNERQTAAVSSSSSASAADFKDSALRSIRLIDPATAAKLSPTNSPSRKNPFAPQSL